MRCTIKNVLVEVEDGDIIKNCSCQDTCCEVCKNEDCHEGCKLFEEDHKCSTCEFCV